VSQLAHAARLAVVFATLAAAAWTLVAGHVVTTGLLAAAAIGQTVLLARAGRRTEADVARFLAGVAAADPAAARPRSSPLARAFDDATARMQARLDAVARDGHYHAAVVASVPIPVVAITGDRVALLNAAARRLVGPGRATALDDLRSLGAELVRDVVDAAPGGRRLTRLDVDGVTRTYVATVSEVAIAGTVTRLVALQDIQGEIDAAALRAWDQMVRVLAHEIIGSVTPVASLTATAAELVEAAGRDGATGDALTEARDALATAARRCDALLDFVARYRRFSSVPAPRRTTVAVAAVFTGVRELFAGEIAAGGVDVHTAIEPLDLTVDADPVLIEQAVINLVRNALDAVAGAPDAEVRLRARRTRDGRVLIEVTDNGPGVAAELAEQIYTPFFTTKRGGSGIGLSLVQQIALAHGGASWCTNRTDGGAVFALSL
jgi:two-component system, NtrC family, nitrogen regulation sensor histidine kinase NtrY